MFRRKKAEKQAAIAGLADVSFFEGFTSEELARVADLADEVEAEAGAALMDQGRPGQECYVILDGTAGVYFGGEHVATLEAGSMVGEMALIDHQPRSATVVAETPMRLLAFDTRHFRALLDDLPKASQRVMSLLNARAQENADRAARAEPVLGTVSVRWSVAQTVPRTARSERRRPSDGAVGVVADVLVVVEERGQDRASSRGRPRPVAVRGEGGGDGQRRGAVTVVHDRVGLDGHRALVVGGELPRHRRRPRPGGGPTRNAVGAAGGCRRPRTPPCWPGRRWPRPGRARRDRPAATSTMVAIAWVT